MARELIPEIHDALKLTALEHDFSDFADLKAFEPKTISWKGVKYHHTGEKDKYYPIDVETFVLQMADKIAAGVSRHKPALRSENKTTEFEEEVEEEKGYETVCKVWNPITAEDKRKIKDYRLKRRDEIIELLKFLSTDPSAQDYLLRYNDILVNRAEHAHRGWNVTSLMTHSVLTGKLYRIFGNADIFPIHPDEMKDATKEKVILLTEGKMKEWKLNVALCQLKFFQKPYRVKDLNIFEDLNNLVSEIHTKFGDHVFFKASDQLLLVYAKEETFDAIFRLARAKGFWIRKVWFEQNLEGIRTKLRRDMSDWKSTNVYVEQGKELPSTLGIRICEICQMDEATVHLPTETGGEEHLCRICAALRRRPTKLAKYQKWQETAGKVVWIKISLNFDRLKKSLRELYVDHLGQFRLAMKEEDIKIKLSLISEFESDYHAFLNSFRDALEKKRGQQSVEKILPDFFCVRIKGNLEILNILELFYDLFRNSFSKFLEAENSPKHEQKHSPLKLNLLCCDPKFPFFEIWRIIEENEVDPTKNQGCFVSLIGHGNLNIKISSIRMLMEAKKKAFRKTSLHNLAQIAKISESLAHLRFSGRFDKKDYMQFSTLQKMLEDELTFKGILTFAEIVGDKK